MARDEAVVLKRSATPTLLGIDSDIRIKILDLLLLNQTHQIKESGRCVLVDIPLHGAVQQAKDITLDSEFERAKAAYPGIHIRKPDFGIRIASVQILRVCRQLFDEGISVLYGKNRFFLLDYRDLNSCIPKIIGRSNMVLIKKLEAQLSTGMTDDFSLWVWSSNYTKALKMELPGLCELTLTSRFCVDPKQYASYCEIPQLNSHRRTMLYTAACIASRHGNLKHAVWDVELHALRPRGSKQGRRTLYVEPTNSLSVTILAEDRSSKFEDARTQQARVNGWEVLSEVNNHVDYLYLRSFDEN